MKLKNKFLLCVIVCAISICAFVMTASAETSPLANYTWETDLSQVAPETVTGTPARPEVMASDGVVVLSGSDGYHVYPAYYILSANTTFTTDYSTLNGLTGQSYSDTSIYMIDIPEGITEINSGKFGSKDSFTIKNVQKVIVPESVTSMGKYCFRGNGSIKSVTVKAHLTEIVGDCFSFMPNIQEIRIDMSTVTKVNDSGFIFSSKELGGNTTTQWYNLNGDNKVDLSNCTYFGTNSFASSNIGSAVITWPQTVTNTNEKCFALCNITGNISLIFDSAQTNGYVGKQAFKGNNIEEVTVKNASYLGNEAFCDCKQLITADINLNGTDEKSIFESVFYRCSALKTVTLEGISAINTNAFNECSALETVEFKGTNPLTAIGGSAFKNDKNLQTINFPSSVKNFASDCFNQCNSLSAMFEGQDENTVLFIDSIGSQALIGCYNLKFKEVVFTKDFTGSIPTRCLQGVQFEKVRIEKGADFCDEINSYAFSNSDNKNVSSLTSFNIGNSYTSIGEAAFNNCGNLREFYISDLVTSISKNAFNVSPSKLIFYYPGTLEAFAGINIVNENNGAITGISDANKINYATNKNAYFTALNSSEGIYLVYNYGGCDVYYNEIEHKNLTSNMTYANGFDNEGSKIDYCDCCGYRHTEELEPIFTALGISYIDNNVYAGFTVNKTALDQYNSFYSDKDMLRYGVFVSNGNVSFLSNGGISSNAIWAEINPESEFSKFGITVSGLESYADRALAYGAYTIDCASGSDYVSIIQKDSVTYDGDDIQAIGDGIAVSTDPVKTVTYSSIKPTENNTLKAAILEKKYSLLCI